MALISMSKGISVTEFYMISFNRKITIKCLGKFFIIYTVQQSGIL